MTAKTVIEPTIDHLGWAHGTRLVGVSEIVDACRRYEEPKYTVICQLEAQIG